MSIYVKSNGTWTLVPTTKGPKYFDGSSWRQASSVWINVNGSWKQVWTQYTPGNSTFTSAGQITVPVGVTTIYITGVGGGGGGGGYGPNPGGAQFYGGGGAAGCIDYPLTVNVGDTVNIVVGYGGSANGNGGQPGGASTVSVNGTVVLTLNGGGGGAGGGYGGASTGTGIYAGTSSSLGYYGSAYRAPSGASSVPVISSNQYGYGGWGSTDYASPPGIQGYMYVRW